MHLNMDKRKLLIVYADASFRKYLGERMRIEKYAVSEASSEEEARKMIQQSDYNVVLLGLTGRHIEGLSLLGSIKEMRPNTEVILMTELDEHSLYYSIQAMQMGAFDDLLVPVDINALLDRVREACLKNVKAERPVTMQARHTTHSKPESARKKPDKEKRPLGKCSR